MKQKVWTKQCTNCHRYVPDDYNLCDYCLREKYNIQLVYDSSDPEGIGPKYVELTEVLRALREVEK